MNDKPVFIVSELNNMRPDDQSFERMIDAQMYAIRSSYNDMVWGIWRDYMDEQELIRIIYGQEVFEK